MGIDALSWVRVRIGAAAGTGGGGSVKYDDFDMSYRNLPSTNTGTNTVIDLYTWTTPNGRKVSIALEEFALPNVDAQTFEVGRQYRAAEVAHARWSARWRAPNRLAVRYRWQSWRD